MRRGVIAIILILCAFVGAWGQNSGSSETKSPQDLILLLDTSASMSASYHEVNNYITGAFLREFLRVGDTFHLITFSDKPRVDISRRIEGRGDVETIIGRMFLQYPLDPWSDIPAALVFAENYASSLPARPKKIILISDGDVSPAPGSSSPVLDAAGLQNSINTTKTRLAGRDIGLEYVKISPGSPLTNLPASGRPPAQTAPAARPPQPTQPTAPQTPTVAPKPQPAQTVPDQPMQRPQPVAPQPAQSTPATPTQPAVPKPQPAQTAPSSVPARTTPAQTAPAPTPSLPMVTEPPPPVQTAPQTPTLPPVEAPPSSSEPITPLPREEPQVAAPQIPQPAVPEPVMPKPAKPKKPAAAASSNEGLPLPMFIGLGVLALFVLGLFIFLISRRLQTGPSRAVARAASPQQSTDKDMPSFVDHSKDLASYAASQLKPRQTPYSDRSPPPPPLNLDPAGPLLLNLFVEDQNTFIGKRNIHSLKSGYSFTIGGGKSDFLIFLVPVPSHIAEVRRDGARCTFIPRKPKYFPDLGSKELPDCVGKTIRIISDKNYELRIRLERYEDPLAALNRMLNSIKVPG